MHMRLGQTFAMASRIPSVYIAHGGGPLPVLGDPGHTHLTAALKGLQKAIYGAPPQSILVISAHWEESQPTITSNPSPTLIYDYSGFPPEGYQLKYPAPGNPALAKRVAALLKAAGLPCKEDPSRGFDHGTFIPLMLAYPEADIPVVQLSLVKSLDPELHLRIGEALSPLREEGVLILGSGLSFHNMRAFQSAMGRGGGFQQKADPRSVIFDNYLKNAVTVGGEEGKRQLIDWAQGPEARFAHPREEHLLPLMVAYGAGKGVPGEVVYSGELLGAQVSSFKFN